MTADPNPSDSRRAGPADTAAASVSAAGGGPARPWLLADIGGTNARFGWLAKGATAVAHVQSLKGVEHAGPIAAAQAYLRRLADELGARFAPPRAAAFAVATAVCGDRIEFTNSGWSFSGAAAQRELGLERLHVLNDFEALALSLPGLTPAQWRPVGPHVPEPASRLARAVLGPGTGLGVAGLVPRGRGGWVAVPGEGGHATLAAADAFESELLAAARRVHGHVSAERMLSGIGLPALHAALAEVLGRPCEPWAADAIVQAGLGGDELAGRTLDAFCALLGSFAGNVALTFDARGGVYVGGGIVPRLGERFHASRFRERFEAKGRFASYLQPIPTVLITDTLAALAGAAVALAQDG